MLLAYHLTPEEWYRAQIDPGGYLPEPFEADGFVHLTCGIEAVLTVGNTFYRADPRPYLLLTVDLDRVTSEVRYDDPERRYPHAYGPLDRAAIIETRRIVRDPSGTFLGVEALDGTSTEAE